MKPKLLIILLSILVLGASFLNFRNTKNFEEEIDLCQNQKDTFRNEASFLKVSLDYSLSLDHSILSNLPVIKDIIIYFSGTSCTSCVENLLIEIKDIDEIQNRTLIISDSEEKNEFIKGFNDSFITNYSYRMDTVTYFEKKIRDVLVLKLTEQKITSLLIYEPEGKHFFKKYFLPIVP